MHMEIKYFGIGSSISLANFFLSAPLKDGDSSTADCDDFFLDLFKTFCDGIMDLSKERRDYRSPPTGDHTVFENYLITNIIGNMILEIK